MVQAADGGGGGGNAGPQEQKLFQAYQARLETLETASQSWSQGAELLATVSQALGAQAGQLETSFGPNNPTGKAAAERYREVQAKVKKRAEEMSTASGALKFSHAGLVTARTDYDGLPPVTTNPHEPQTDLERLMDPGGSLKKAQYDGERAEREKAAGVALAKLDTHFEKSAKDLRTVAGDAPSKGGGGDDGGGDGGGDESGGGSPLGGRQGGGTHVISGVGGVGVDGGKDDSGAVITDHGPRGPRGDVDPGTTTATTTPGPVTVGGSLAGGSTDGTYGGSTSGGSYGGGSTAAPASGSGAGVTSAMGAGAVSGAGAIAASRGGVAGGARATGAPAGSAGAIGRSSSTAARGAIGRGSSMVPGQSSTPARSGGGGGAGGRGAAGGRGTAGAGQGQAGKNGGRGGAGARGRGAMGAGQAGRGGKKDEKDVTQEHLAFTDEESWLDDEGANDSVID